LKNLSSCKKKTLTERRLGYVRCVPLDGAEGIFGAAIVVSSGEAVVELELGGNKEGRKGNNNNKNEK